jgi:hypothetical protein
MSLLDDLERRVSQRGDAFSLPRTPGGAAVANYQQSGSIPEAAGAAVRGVGQFAQDLARQQFNDMGRTVTPMVQGAQDFYRGLTGTGSPTPSPNVNAPKHPQLAGMSAQAQPPAPDGRIPGRINDHSQLPQFPGMAALRPAMPVNQVMRGQTPQGGDTLSIRDAQGGRGDVTLPPGAQARIQQQLGTSGPGNFSVMPGRTPQEQEMIDERVGQLQRATQTIQNARDPQPLRRGGGSSLPSFDLQRAQREADQRAREIERDSFNASMGRGVTARAAALAESIRQSPQERMMQLQLLQSQENLARMHAEGQGAAASAAAARDAQKQGLEVEKFKEEIFRDRRDAQRNEFKDEASRQKDQASQEKPFTISAGTDPNTGLPVEQVVQWNSKSGRYEITQLPPGFQHWFDRARADPANKNVEDRELVEYYQKEYGKR